MKKYLFILHGLLAFLIFATGCTPKAQTADENRELKVNLLYPLPTTEIEMGGSLKSIVQVLDEQGRVVADAQVTLAVSDPAGNPVTSRASTFGGGDVYRTEALAIPHKMHEGLWTLTVEASAGTKQGTTSQTIRVNNSLSEILLNKYGFWVDAPAMKGIVPSLVKERGDAQNGVIIWGGALPSQHIFPESWLEVHWREGDFKLESAEDVRAFMLNELGDMGFTPLRELGPFGQVKFKGWDAWQVKARGQFLRYDGQWMIFHAPEVDKTYAISTTVVHPPSGIEPHEFLRDGFEVHPEMHARGVAPEPLFHLLPPPELVSPPLGVRLFGTDEPITLRWEPVKELAEDEYYLVSIDYNYVETNSRILYSTRETQFTLPESLYSLPNCGIFNWRVTLMQNAGLREDGQPKGEPISFSSLYWYIEWRYPPGEEAPFPLRCPNEQF